MSMNKNESIDDSEFDNAEIPTGRKLMKLNHYNVAGDQKETASSRNDTKSEAISSIPSSHKHISHEVNWNLVNTLKKRVNASLKRSKSK